METADVRKRIKGTIDRAKREAAERRRLNAEATQAYARFLELSAVPIFHQAAGALKAEGFSFIVHTPAGGVRLASVHSPEDFIELSLDTTGRLPQVTARVKRVKGRETVLEDRALRPGVLVEHLTEQDVLDLLADALTAFVER
jgi:hypothetical protein